MDYENFINYYRLQITKESFAEWLKVVKGYKKEDAEIEAELYFN